MVLYKNFINEEGLQNIVNYKYASTGYTEIDLLMNHFWIALVDYLPRNWAPNLITVFASCGQVIPALLMLIIDPSLDSRYPAIILLLGAFGIFFHQTLDALDGKQARRIGASSPLGQLFDHGCDCFTSSYLVLIVCAQDGFSSDEHLFWGQAKFNTFAFYIMNWTEYHSHESATRVGQLGVTEIQFIVIIAQVFNALTGVGIAEISIFKGFTAGNLIFYCITYPSPFYFYYAWGFAAPHIKDVKKALLKLVPLVFLQVSLTLLSTIKEFSGFKGWVVIGYGSYTTLMTCKQIVSGLARTDFAVIHFELIYLLLLSILAKTVGGPILKNLIFLLIFVGGYFFFFDFGIDIVTRIAKKLKINVLTITPKKES